MKERLYDCAGCDCCSFVVLKTKTHRAHRHKGKYWFVKGDRLRIGGSEFFSWHGIRLTVFKDTMVYEFKLGKKPLLWKERGKWLYYRVDLGCRYLLGNRRCRIYARRPQICREATCPLIDDEKKDLYFGPWDIVVGNFDPGAGTS